MSRRRRQVGIGGVSLRRNDRPGDCRSSWAGGTDGSQTAAVTVLLSSLRARFAGAGPDDGDRARRGGGGGGGLAGMARWVL